MKTLVIFCLVAAVVADKFRMNLEENGEKFAEEIEIDVAGETEEIKVPKHQDRIQVDLLNDFNMGLSAAKLPAVRKCHISKIEKTEQSPMQMKQSLEKSHSRFPTERYFVKTETSLIVRRMTADEVGQKIAAHCRGYELLYTVKVRQDNIEKEAVRQAENMIRRTKRSGQSTTISQFYACTLASTNVISRCDLKKARLGARCSFWRSDLRRCIYKIDCSSQGASAVCNGSHQFDLMQCCDFICIPFGK